MNISMTGNNRPLLFLLFIAVFFVVFSTQIQAVTSQEFINRMKVKFRQTSNIYMEARSHKVTQDGTYTDTMNVTLAYRYPDQLFQWVRGSANREQVLIYRGDSVVIAYPHIDVERRRTIDRKSLSRLIVNQVPFAAIFVGISSDAVSPDSMTVTPRNGALDVRFSPGKQGNGLKWVDARFRGDNLHPKSFIIQNEYTRYRVNIREYREEERFPGPVEKAINELRPGYVEELVR